MIPIGLVAALDVTRRTNDQLDESRGMIMFYKILGSDSDGRRGRERNLTTGKSGNENVL